MNGFDRRTGERNRCYACKSEEFYEPQRPQKENRYGGSPQSCRNAKYSPSRHYCSIAAEPPPAVWPSGKSGSGGPGRLREQSFSTTLGIGGQFAVAQADGVVALDTGATANLVCFK